MKLLSSVLMEIFFKYILIYRYARARKMKGRIP